MGFWWVSGRSVFSKESDISMWSVWLTPDKCHCQASLFALPCTSEKPGRGILSLSGITLWTTCSSGALSSSVVTNNAAGPVTLLWESRVLVICGWGRTCVCVFLYFLCVFAATHLPFRRGLELSPSLLLCISLVLINSLGLYDWGDCLEALNPIQLIKS